MTTYTMRAMMLQLLGTTALAMPSFAQDAPAPPPADTAILGSTESPPTPKPNTAAAPSDVDSNEIVVTATKREENLQNVPISIQAIGTKRLDQLNISNFEQYTKQLPSVSFQTSAPGATVVYMRGVATGGDGNHTGSLPSVGSYLDEQPITTIGGTLDVHIYDVARIESLAGPQGTLYGASSEAGTIRIITNKPQLGVTSGRVDGELNTVSNGGIGSKLEGMINVPIASRMALRAVAFYQRDAGYIDNVFGERTYCGDAVKVQDPSPDAAPGDLITVGCVRNGIHVDNQRFVKKNFNDNTVYGGRAALKIDLDDNWTITPTIMHQNQKSNGVFYYDKALGPLKTQRFRNEPSVDKFTQAALTIEGKIGNFDLTYAGAYLDRPTHAVNDYTDYADAYDAYYESAGGIANYLYYTDNAGNQVDPRQYITGGNHFKKMSQELRIASPAENRFRVIAGAFYQHQSNDILQEYHVDNLADNLSVNGRPGLIWLTKQKRVDRDYALFGEASFDVTPNLTLTGGGRYYKFDNTVFGFAGYGRDPAFIQGADNAGPPNAAGSSKTGVAQCFTTSGDTLRQSQQNGTDTTFILDGVLPGTPCINVGRFENGKVLPKQSKGDGFTYRFNGTWKPRQGMLFYGTWSKGFRPGGINRQPGLAGYNPDFLVNYEFGWKASLGRLRWNGAAYHQIWQKFQFSFLGESSLTVVQNGRDAVINGIESDINYLAGGLSLIAAAAYTDAKTKGNICNYAFGNAQCTGFDANGNPDFIAAKSGTRLPVTPKFKITGTARYSWPMGAGKAHVQAAAVYQTSARAALKTDEGGGFDSNSILGRIRPSTLVDFYAGYDWHNISLELFTTNVFDQRNDLSRFVVCGLCTNVHVVPGRPRTIGVRAGFKL